MNHFRKHLARMAQGIEEEEARATVSSGNWSEPALLKEEQARINLIAAYRPLRRCGHCGEAGHDLRNCVLLLEPAF